MCDVWRCRPAVLAEAVIHNSEGRERGRLRVLLPGGLADPEEDTAALYAHIVGHPWAQADAVRLAEAHAALGLGAVTVLRGPLGQTTRLGVHPLACPGPGWLATCGWRLPMADSTPPNHWEVFTIRVGVWWSPELVAAARGIC